MLRAIRRWMFAGFILLITWLAAWRTPSLQRDNERVHPLNDNLALNGSQSRIMVSVVSVCDIGVLLGLERAIPMADIVEVILSCTNEDLKAFKSFWMNMAANLSQTIRIAEAASHYSPEFSLLLAGSNAIGTSVLVLDSVLESTSKDWVDEALTIVKDSPLPVGPCGFNVLSTGRVHMATPIPGIHPVAFLRPPFIIDRQRLFDGLDGMSTRLSPWVAFGIQLSESPGRFQGGLQSPLSSASYQSCPKHIPSADAMIPSNPIARINFMAILPNRYHLVEFQDTYCRLASRGNGTAMVLSAEGNQSLEIGWIAAKNCYFRYIVLPSPSIMDTIKLKAPTILLYIHDESLDLKVQAMASGTILVPLYEQDLPHAEWLGTLNLEEWKSWHTMQLDIAVITNTRPRSLARLLHSLDSALYFGPSDIHLTINIEQTADTETRHIAQHFKWRHGRLTLRHRVVLGGLIPAIVESWYPATNHSYGLILEDDIEVSPLYFAWIKMNILRYRYGAPATRRPYLYGISLYHPKNVELRPEGRRPWSAQELFRNSSLPFPDIPYLSSTPCSWGAVYFPEHWTEFHGFIVRRMSTSFVPLDTEIVPNVRSNFWKKSWKRFFIEFAWLRGYLMLYPNYDNFLAFSTNHVEVGSHVSDALAKARKKALFGVPLMSLQDAMTSFLQLPGNELPGLDDLPVVDLHGHLSSIDTLLTQGEAKRRELCGQPAQPISYDAGELLCKH